jgi:hypothetical protein
MSIFILGAGFTSRAYIRRMRGEDVELFGTTRSSERFGQITAMGAKPLIFDGTEFTSATRDALASTTSLIVSISPGDNDPVLSTLDGDLKRHMPKLEWVCYLSTVGVYGDHEGVWVTEETECKPVSERSHQRLAAEAAWQKACEADHLPLSIFRLSGIYGQGRNTFVNFQKGRARRLIKPGQVFNRIYVEDIASAMELARLQRADGIFNITDDEPAPPQDVVSEAAAIMGVPAPREVDFETADLTPMARSFYGENKRVSNAKARAELGWQPAFPNYRLALHHLWQVDWATEPGI